MKIYKIPKIEKSSYSEQNRKHGKGPGYIVTPEVDKTNKQIAIGNRRFDFNYIDAGKVISFSNQRFKEGDSINYLGHIRQVEEHKTISTQQGQYVHKYTLRKEKNATTPDVVYDIFPVGELQEMIKKVRTKGE